jgi:multiple sugar transport system permease protein/putative aldouronate transport system permease protein
MSKEFKIGQKLHIGDKAFEIVNMLLFLLFSISCFYPFYLVIICSISGNHLVAAGQIRFWPQAIHFENYLAVFRIKDIGEAAFTSVARTVICTLTTLCACSFMGYAMTRQEYWHRKFWYRFIVATMYFNAGLIPGYLNMRRLGLMNSFVGVYVVPTLIGGAYNIILTKTYIESIPASLEEAAIVDGAGYFKRFTLVILPLTKPILATLAVFTSVAQWNSYMDTILYMTSGQYQTLQTILYRYLNQANIVAQAVKQGAMVTEDLAKQLNTTSLRYTITAVTLIPILLVYPFMQRYFTKGIMIGAIKG